MSERLLFRVHRAELLPAVTAVLEAVSSRATIPILSNVLLLPSEEVLTLRGTDLDIEVQATCEALEVASTGGITLSVSALRDLAKNAPESCEIGFYAGELDGQLLVRAGKSRFKLHTLPERDFPSLADKVKGSGFDIDMPALLSAVARVEYAIQQSETRPQLSGLFLHVQNDTGKIVTVGCDGHNLSVVRFAPSEGVTFQPVILPFKTMRSLKKLFGEVKGSAAVTITDALIRVEAGSTCMISKLVEATYPDYMRTVPAAVNHEAVIPVEPFKRAVARVSLVAKDTDVDTVKLKLSAEGLWLSMTTKDGESASEDIEASYAGEPVEAGFNGKYLIQMLSSIGHQSVRVAITDAGTAAVFRAASGGEEFLLLMPRTSRRSRRS